MIEVIRRDLHPGLASRNCALTFEAITLRHRLISLLNEVRSDHLSAFSIPARDQFARHLGKPGEGGLEPATDRAAIQSDFFITCMLSGACE